ncbi:MAG TPA: alpha-hydroxy acid oxidase [Thermoplasmata archaeon]|nr:alpha-hydroxy acid oxidase [Thermoplasmata archaeon]
MADGPGAGFVTLAELEQVAARRATPDAWSYVESGAVGEDAARANRDAFRRRTLRPRVLVDVSVLDLRTRLLDAPVAVPFYVCPMARQGLFHPDAELATARAAAGAGALAVQSTLSTRSLEEIAAAAPGHLQWFQLYLQPDFAASRQLVERAERAGYAALVVTVDAPILGIRDPLLGSSFVLDPEGAIGNGPGVKAPPREPSGAQGRYTLRADAGATWNTLDDLQSITRLPVVVKGLLTGDDAGRAVKHGARAVIVSNHGGRQLDVAGAALEALPEVVRAVGSDVEVYFDSGVRRGGDVLIALALGARAVGIGRPVLWALQAGGEAGVARLLDLFAKEVATEMALLGRRRIGEIDRTVLGEPRW